MLKFSLKFYIFKFTAYVEIAAFEQERENEENIDFFFL